MKPHLPIALLSLLSVASLAQGIEIPVDYEVVGLHSCDEINAYTSNSSEDKYAFILDSDLAFAPTTNTSWSSSTPLVSGGNVIFTTSEDVDLVSLSFFGGPNSAFYTPSNLTFDTLETLTFSNQTNNTSYGGGVFDFDGVKSNLYIKNVDDGIANVDIPDVLISRNKAYLNGGAFYARSAGNYIEFSNNGDIAISQNSAWNASSVATEVSASGGAIYSYGSMMFNNNHGNICFIDNNATAKAEGNAVDKVLSYGGAMYMFNSNKSVTIDATAGDVLFSCNYTESTASINYNIAESYGGAIYSKGVVNIINNEGSVIFFNNYSAATSTLNSKSYGGAIYSSVNISIVNNKKDVSFVNNCASSDNMRSAGYAYGGAIFSTGIISICNNAGNVNFSGNCAISSSYNSYAYGGAIYSQNDIYIIGNESVVFEKNYEKRGRFSDEFIYNLRSVYMDSNSSLKLSAKNDCNITFYDSVYMGNHSGVKVSLNADYEDANGVTQKATGDIVFSGKYTEEHLKEVKGSAGTSTEIANSRTSELLNTVNLYGGTLRVEDKAVLKTHAINVVAEGNATMKVLDAEVNASTYDVTINSTGQLTLGGTDGSAKLTAKNININQGATLSAERTEVPEATPSITLAAEETVSIFNEKLGGVASGNLNLAAGSAYKADGAHLSVINGTLTFNSTEDEKISLILTLGAQYDKDSQIILFTDVNTVKFVLDNITASKTGQVITLNAADYFTGDWINENTSLVYDKGTIYVTGVNRVIPEPTTATLSLLALAVLVARRRR